MLNYTSVGEGEYCFETDIATALASLNVANGTNVRPFDRSSPFYARVCLADLRCPLTGDADGPLRRRRWRPLPGAPPPSASVALPPMPLLTSPARRSLPNPQCADVVLLTDISTPANETCASVLAEATSTSSAGASSTAPASASASASGTSGTEGVVTRAGALAVVLGIAGVVAAVL